jgi:uncharacterized membrane protein YkvA (DUF1232 family)
MEERTKELQKIFPSATNHLLILPRFVKLLLALFRDIRVPKYLKIITAGAILYVALPLDFLPDFVPVAGFADDIIVILLILTQYMRFCPPEVFREHWNNIMGDDFNLEAALTKTMDVLEPVVGLRFEAIRKYALKLVDKYNEKVSGSEPPAARIPESGS